MLVVCSPSARRYLACLLAESIMILRIGTVLHRREFDPESGHHSVLSCAWLSQEEVRNRSPIRNHVVDKQIPFLRDPDRYQLALADGIARLWIEVEVNPRFIRQTGLHLSCHLVDEHFVAASFECV
jgi:hypothetical protein